MAARLTINFDNLYDIENISQDLKFSSFRTERNSGGEVPLVVRISNQAHALLPNVYNLSFGPLNAKGKLDDKAEAITAYAALNRQTFVPAAGEAAAKGARAGRAATGRGPARPAPRPR